MHIWNFGVRSRHHRILWDVITSPRSRELFWHQSSNISSHVNFPVQHACDIWDDLQISCTMSNVTFSLSLNIGIWLNEHYDDNINSLAPGRCGSNFAELVTCDMYTLPFSMSCPWHPCSQCHQLPISSWLWLQHDHWPTPRRGRPTFIWLRWIYLVWTFNIIYSNRWHSREAEV